MVKYTAREYQSGDGPAINDLYLSVTGRSRSYCEFAWQWLDAPAGEGEMWVIEANEDDGSTHIIGHHGLMPLFFSKGDETVIAGKTENTMVHPEFRRKVLYPPHEKRFLKNYSDRFDLLFSTMGPSAAMRQRKALGYDDTRRWLRFDIGLVRFALPGLILAQSELSNLAARSLKHKVVVGSLKLLAGLSGLVPRWRCNRNLRELEVYDDQVAKSVPFFDDFWKETAPQYPLTPRREKADLAWRFWDNPNVAYTTLVHANGFAVLSRPHRYLFRVEDIVATPYDTEHFQKLLGLVAAWCAEQGGHALTFITTDDPSSPAEMVGGSGLRKLHTSKLRKYVRAEMDSRMLRRVTARGKENGASVEDWYVTSFVMEGRT